MINANNRSVRLWGNKKNATIASVRPYINDDCYWRKGNEKFAHGNRQAPFVTYRWNETDGTEKAENY